MHPTMRLARLEGGGAEFLGKDRSFDCPAMLDHAPGLGYTIRYKAARPYAHPLAAGDKRCLIKPVAPGP